MTKIRPDLRLRANRFSEEVFPALRNTGLGGFSGSSGDGRRRRQQTVSNSAPSSGAGGVAGEGWGDGEGLVGAGLGDVQLAWDFVTASEESQLGMLRAMRETSRIWLDAALSAPTSPAPAPAPPLRRLRDLAAAEGEGDFDAERKSENDRGGRGGGSGSGSQARSDSRERRGSGNGRGDDERERRRRTASDSGQSPPTAPLYRVVKVEQFADYINSGGDDDTHYNTENPAIARTVWGRMRIPAFVSASARGTGLLGGWETAADNGGGGEGGVGRETSSSSSSSASSAAAAQATLEAGFVVRVPRCVANGKKKPSALVQYGHGLFGDRSEVEDGFLDIMAERGAWVLVAADWRGMSRVDLAVVARALVSRPELLFAGTPEDLMQVCEH